MTSWTLNAPPPIPPPKPRSKRRWVVPLIVGIFALFLGVGIGSDGARVESLQAELEGTYTEINSLEADLLDRDVEVSRLQGQVEALETQLGELGEPIPEDSAALEDAGSGKDADPQAEAQGQATTFGEGLQLVGADIQPGSYRAMNSSVFCYWERLSGLSGELGDIIANDIPSGAAVVSILETDVAFDSTGCGMWEKID